jgi:hypothetical protein
MKKIGEKLLGIALLIALAGPLYAAGGGTTSKPFDQGGVIVDVHTFFKTAAGQQKPETTQASPADLALVTAEGLYTFLETPENQKWLTGTESGAVVHIKGKLLKKGALLHIDALEPASKISLDLDLAGLRNASGEKITLKGTNKCQCGLDVADLPHSCALGHLHHLEAEDGLTYNYLQVAQGKEAFLGQGSHFKSVEIQGKVFPGHFLLVEKVEVD